MPDEMYYGMECFIHELMRFKLNQFMNGAQQNMEWPAQYLFSSIQFKFKEKTFSFNFRIEMESKRSILTVIRDI